MADVQQAQASLLTSKWGPLPVWAWSLIGLGVAWVYAKWRASQQDKAQANQDTATDADTGMGTDQTQAVAPQFVIENNLPPTVPSESSPVTTPTTPPVQSTPPGTGSHPPVVTPPPKTGSGSTGGKTPAPAKKPPVTVKKPTPAKKPPLQYKVVHGDTLSSIAARYHTTAAKLFAYNTTPGNRPAATIATLKKRGPNLLYAGETILIPQ